MQAIKRAFADTFGHLRGLLVAALAGAISLAALYGWKGRDVANEEIAYVVTGLIGAAGAVILLFLWNWAAAPYRIQRDRADAAEARLRQQSIFPASPDDDLVPLEGGATIQIDCTRGRSFHVTLTQHATMLLPKNPREGTYRLYVVQGDKQFALSVQNGFADWRFSDQRILTKADDITIFEINIIEQSKHKFLYYGCVIYETGTRYETVRISAKNILPSAPKPCKREPATFGDENDYYYAEFDSNVETHGRFEVTVPARGFGYGYCRFSLEFSVSEEAPSDGAAIFEIVPCPYGELEAATVTIVATGKPGYHQTSDWSQVSTQGVETGQPCTCRIRRKVESENDTWGFPVKIHSIEIECSEFDPHEG